MNLQKSIIILLFITVSFFYSCNEREKNFANENSTLAQYTKEEIKQARALFITPDSLRSSKEKVLYRKIIKAHMIKDDHFEIAVSKKAWKEEGLPEIYYDIVINDIKDLNYFFDLNKATISPSDKQAIFDSFRKAQEEYKNCNNLNVIH
jgi:hypothetical protein